MPPRQSSSRNGLATAADLVSRLAMLDWSWIKEPLEKELGEPLREEDYKAILTELHRFVAIKVIKEDLDARNEFAPHGVMDAAFHMLLLNPYFVANAMKLLDCPGQVLSHVPGDRADHEARVKEYYKHYKAVFGSEPPRKLPSSRELWPALAPAGRGRPISTQAKRERPSSTESAAAQKRQRSSSSFPEVVHVKTLTGMVMTFRFQSSSDATVRQLLNQIHEREGIPPGQCRLAFAGRVLQSYVNETTDLWVGPEVFLAPYGIRSEAVIHLILKLRGC